MSNELLKMILGQGIFCALFVWLLIKTMDENKKREINYQNTIQKNQEIIKDLAAKFTVIETVKKDVEDIKEEIKTIRK